MTAAQTPDVESCIVALVKALQESKGWLHDYADAVIRDAIDRRGLSAALEVVAYFLEGGRTWKSRALSTADPAMAEKEAQSRKDGSTASALIRLSDAQASLLAKEAECEALRSALSGVKNAGAPLANFAFNLAQHPGRSLNQRECDLIDLCRKDWDAAIDAALVAAKGVS